MSKQLLRFGIVIALVLIVVSVTVLLNNAPRHLSADSPDAVPSLLLSPAATPLVTQTPMEVSEEVPPELLATETPVTASTDVPSSTIGNEPTVSPEQRLLATITPAPPAKLNGLLVEQFIVMSDTVRQHIREIYAAGQTLGRNPHAFSKLGDSTIVYPLFLGIWDKKTKGAYNLGDYTYLQPSIDQFAGSFSRIGLASRKGLHSWSVFDPMWADKTQCQPNEDVLTCEIRLNNPAILIIRLGAHDRDAAKLFDKNMRKIVETVIADGVIPVIGTKPDHADGPDNAVNNALRKIAADYNIPLWDFDLVAGTAPDRGLYQDNVHMYSSKSFDFSTPKPFESGSALHDLTGLMVLDAIRREVMPTNP